jgi:CRP/FNR family transcriptional regulator, cyclic AMP receptor protein
MSPDNETVLLDVPFFEKLDLEERRTLAGQIETVQYPAGHQLFAVGDPGDSLYVLTKGQVEIYFKDTTGHRVVLETLGAGEFLGEISLLDAGPRTASVVVTEDMEAIKVDRQDLDALIRRHPHAALDLLAATGRRLRQTVGLLRQTASRNVNQEVEDTRTAVQRVADWIAEFSGSLTFLFLHLLWFFSWIMLNTKWASSIEVPWIQAMTGFDPFPYGLLTMTVSLEAIVLSVFVLLSQSRQVAKDKIRSDIEYDVNLKAELEVAQLHEKVDRFHSEALARMERIEKLLSSR